MLTLGIKINSLEVEHNDSKGLWFENHQVSLSKGYKKVAKYLWNMCKANPGCDLWLNTDVYVSYRGEWLLFQCFDDKMYIGNGSDDSKKNFSTRKRMARYVAERIKAIEHEMREREIPRIYDIPSEDVAILYID